MLGAVDNGPLSGARLTFSVHRRTLVVFLKYARVTSDKCDLSRLCRLWRGKFARCKMGWDAENRVSNGGSVHEVYIRCRGVRVSYAEVIECWQYDTPFQQFFVELLAATPFAAYLWETPPITRRTATRPFEFVLIDSPTLATLSPDPAAFGG